MRWQGRGTLQHVLNFTHITRKSEGFFPGPQNFFEGISILFLQYRNGQMKGIAKAQRAAMIAQGRG